MSGRRTKALRKWAAAKFPGGYSTADWRRIKRGWTRGNRSLR